MQRFLLALLLLLTACAPATLSTDISGNPASSDAGTSQVVRVHTSAAAQPWLANAYRCADELGLILQTVDDPQQAEISLRLGEPEQLASPAYQIGQDDLLVVTRSDSPLQNLSLENVQSLFSHSGVPDAQLWVYPAGEDVEQVFSREILHGRALNSFAHLAASPQQMADSLGQDKNAVGILSRKWKTGALREVFILPNLPALAIVKSEPQGSIKSLLACIQK